MFIGYLTQTVSYTRYTPIYIGVFVVKELLVDCNVNDSLSKVFIQPVSFTV